MGVCVVGLGPVSEIEPFQEKVGFKGMIYTDPERKVYTALEVKIAQSFSEMKSDKPSPHEKTGFFWGMAWSIGTMLTSKEGTGDTKTMGAEMILGKGETCHFVHFQQNPADMTEVGELRRRLFEE
uniref:Uncharacterized protein n=1 Tax=Paramoeba aestuarina TaxID=180227 RepID=A0A7S4NF91_9EUKA|mmetsp:Transcript_15368/g.24043  ORF Transcript_15368/g.24043 Transcript_15368/m.24043 type:complete len:125 (+) Transcript_15368:345-719(+)